MRRLLLGISSGICYTALSIATGLIAVPVYLKFLSREEFGLFLLFNNTIVWAGLLNGGLRGSFKVQLAASFGRENNLEKLSSSLFFGQCLIALVAGAGGFGASFTLPALFTISAAYSSTAQYLFIVLSLAFACSLVSNGLTIILSVHNRDFHVYTARSLQAVVQTLLSLSLLSLGWGSISLAIPALVTEIIFIGYLLFLIRNRFRLAQLKPSHFDKAVLTKSLSLGKWFLAGFLAQLLLKHTDLFLVAHFNGVKNVAGFIFSAKLYLLAFGLVQLIVRIVTPQMIRLVQNEGYGLADKNLLQVFLNLSAGSIFLAGTAIYFFNEAFISWWIGKSYYLGNFENLMLMLSFVFTSLANITRAVHTARLEWKDQKISALAEGILHLTLAFGLGYFWGIKGMVTGIAFAAFTGALFSLSPLLKQNIILSPDLNSRQLFSFVLIVVSTVLTTIVLPSFQTSVLAFCLNMTSFLFMFSRELRILALKFVKN